MHWEWVVPVGIVLFWIINSLFQGAESASVPA